MSGIVSEQKGESLPKVSSSIQIENNIGEQLTTPLTIAEAMKETRCQLEINKPNCLIETLSIKLSKSEDNGIEKLRSDATIEGVGELST